MLNWFTRCFVCIRWCGCYSYWFPILASVRQGGVLSPLLYAVYITKLRQRGLGCKLFDLFYACLVYADDILLLAHCKWHEALRMVRWTCNVKVKDRVPSKELRERLGTDNIILILQQNRLQLYEHVLRKKTLTGRRNVWNMRWRAPDQEVYQRGRGQRLCKKTAKHVI